jgi:pimeloyl-ACP methyl ester carboxylesterase
MLGPRIGAAMAAMANGDQAAAFDIFLAAVAGAGYRDVLTMVLTPDGLRRAEQQCGYFLTDEVPTLGRWGFDRADAVRTARPVLLVGGGASPPVVHRMITHVAGMLPGARIATLEGQDHLLPLTAPAALADLLVHHARRHPLRLGT